MLPPDTSSTTSSVQRVASVWTPAYGETVRELSALTLLNSGRVLTLMWTLSWKTRGEGWEAGTGVCSTGGGAETPMELIALPEIESAGVIFIFGSHRYSSVKRLQ